MDPQSQPAKLRLAPEATAEELARRFERERRVVNQQREAGLEEGLSPFRVGSVPYLNAAPLTRGIEDQLLLATPSELAKLLRKDELDAALVSLVEVLRTDRYDILDGIAIASLGEVQSVVVAHRRPLSEVTEIACDPASISSVTLLRVLLAEEGLSPRLVPLEDYGQAARPEAVLLIGDVAIDFVRSSPLHQIYDLGAAWYELTRLPFVYAVWALRRGVENTRLRRLLRETRDFGLDTLDSIIEDRTDFDLAFRKDYLGWIIHYHLGSDEKRGIARLLDLMTKHKLGPVYEPRFVS